MTTLKRLSPAAIPGALEKALRYRLLNEPLEAESICRDILAVDSDNGEAIVTLILALTDQFDTQYVTAVDQARQFVRQLATDYEREYYTGIVNERWGKAALDKGVPSHVAFGWIREAMRCYERAEVLAEPGNEDALLRWNACARSLEGDQSTVEGEPTMSNDLAHSFGDEMPPR
jgi:hypothetical protein